MQFLACQELLAASLAVTSVAVTQERTLGSAAKNVLRESWTYTKTFGKWVARRTGQGVVKLGVLCQGKYACASTQTLCCLKDQTSA